MATDDERDPDRQSVYETLAVELQRCHPGTHADAMATAVLRYADESIRVIALTEAAEEVVLYDHDARTVEAVPVDKHGVHAEDGGCSGTKSVIPRRGSTPTPTPSRGCIHGIGGCWRPTSRRGWWAPDP